MKNLALKVQRFLVSEDGPTAVEYAVMLALIIVVCLAAITTLGQNANTTFTKVAVKMSLVVVPTIEGDLRPRLGIAFLPLLEDALKADKAAKAFRWEAHGCFEPAPKLPVAEPELPRHDFEVERPHAPRKLSGGLRHYGVTQAATAAKEVLDQRHPSLGSSRRPQTTP